MTIFAGIVARGGAGQAISESWIAELRRNISRNTADAPSVLRDQHYAFAWVDLRHSAAPVAHVDAAGAMTIVAGDPILGGGQNDLNRLHDEFRSSSCSRLRQARGAFCAMHFDPVSRRLWLIADRLGLRPIYYSVQPEFVVFASAFRILEASALVGRHGDLQALAETASFGYALGPRSPLAQVRSIEPGQIVEVLPGTSRVYEYWRWDDVQSAEASEPQICQQLFATFRDAIAVRLGARRHAVALLSGGLDSRCVVSGLRSLDVEVDTIGFGPEGSADQYLSRRVAAALKTRHFELAHGIPDFWPRLASAYAGWQQQAPVSVRQHAEHYLWSGEGGERVLAPVNLSTGVAAAMRHGDVERAIGAYMRAEHVDLPGRLFRKGWRHDLRGLPKSGMRSELGRRTSEDPARRFHVYVLVNEARHNIAPHFEDLDLSRFELVMPFFDAELVRLVLSFPIDPFIAHHLYHRWLLEFPAEVRTVPWQAYPSSAPCPLPMPAGVPLQWERWYTPQQQKARWQQQELLADSVVSVQAFPDWLLNRTLLRCARLLHRMGLRRYGHLFEAAWPFVKYPPASPPAISG